MKLGILAFMGMLLGAHVCIGAELDAELNKERKPRLTIDVGDQPAAIMVEINDKPSQKAHKTPHPTKEQFFTLPIVKKPASRVRFLRSEATLGVALGAGGPVTMPEFEVVRNKQETPTEKERRKKDSLATGLAKAFADVVDIVDKEVAGIMAKEQQSSPTAIAQAAKERSSSFARRSPALTTKEQEEEILRKVDDFKDKLLECHKKHMVRAASMSKKQ